MGRIYVNNFATSTAATITNVATTISISSATGLPTLTGTQYYYLTLGGSGTTEIVKVTARTGTTLTVVRAQESTTGVAWASGTPVRMNFTKDSLAITTTPTENTSAYWDSSLNLNTNNSVENLTSTATAAGTTTLVVTSSKIQQFTGVTTQTCILPVTSTLKTGFSFDVVNNSSGVVTVQSSGANTIYAQPASTRVIYTCILTSGTSAASWTYVAASAGTVTEAFKTIAVSGQSDVVADLAADTLTLAAGTNITLTTNAGTDTITIAASGGGGGGLDAYTTTATAAGTTTLTVSSNYQQFFTGVTTQICVMPDVTTLVLGQSWKITNNSTGNVTVRSSGANTILTMAGGTQAIVTCILLTGTGVASWDYNYQPNANAITGTGGLVRATSPTLVTPILGTPTSGDLTSCTALPLTTGITGTLAVTNGGTGRATSTTAYGILQAGTTATGAHRTVPPGAAGTILRSGGSAADAAYGTATWPDTTTVNQILHSSATNTVTGITTVNSAMLVTSAGGVPSFVASTGSGAPVRATSPSLVTPVLDVATATSINFGQDPLNYYDEGTFTPTFTFSTPGDLSVVYTTQTGVFTRIGRFVHAFVIITITSGTTYTTASGDVRIGGFPFNFGSTIGGVLSGKSNTMTYPAGTTQLYPLGVSGTSYCTIRGMGSGVAVVDCGPTEFPTAASRTLTLTITYYV